MNQFFQIGLSGLTTGAIYALIALGFTIVFNATRVTNFANGEFVMMGGLVSAWLVNSFGWHPLPAVLAAVLVVALLAVLLVRLGIEQARRKTVLSFAMITIGFSIAYRGLMQVTVGRDVIFVAPFGLFPDLRAFGLRLNSQAIWVLLTLVVLSGLLTHLFLKTRIGKAMRAASQSPRGAALCGIDPQRMSMLAFALAGVAGALAGALIAPIGAAFYEYGLTFGLKGFAAAILGGFGSPVGAVLGGVLLGLVEAFAAGYLDSGYKDAIALAILLGLLLLWPTGLLGRVDARRV